MLGLILLSLFIIIVGAIIVFEVRSERRYKEQRKLERQNTFLKKQKSKKQERSPSPKKPQKVVAQKKAEVKLEEKVQVAKKEVKTEPVKKNLPQANYPRFSHQRLIEMGLSDEEAIEFVQELIPQLEAEMPLIEEVLEIPDFHKMERLTHGLKGSATNIGTGGISDVLIACNTYLKTGTDIDIAKTYFTHLKHYTQELKKQYS